MLEQCNYDTVIKMSLINPRTCYFLAFMRVTNIDSHCRVCSSVGRLFYITLPTFLCDLCRTNVSKRHGMINAAFCILGGICVSFKKGLCMNTSMLIERIGNC